MDNNTLAIYIHELRNLLFNTQGSFNLFNGAMQQRQAAGILYAGQLVLVPVSQLSALLWPPRARARSRGEALRKVLQLPEKHVLNDRRLSELADRGDEKMDDWIASTKGQQIMIDFVGDVKQATEQFEGTLGTDGIYRAYDPNTLIYYYRGVGYNFKAIADALSDIAARVNNVYAQMFPEQAKAEAEAQKKLMEQQQQAQAEAQAGAANDTAPDADQEAPQSETKD